MCSFIRKCAFGPIKHDLCYFFAKSVGLEHAHFGVNFCLRKSCLCKETNKYDVCAQGGFDICYKEESKEYQFCIPLSFVSRRFHSLNFKKENKSFATLKKTTQEKGIVGGIRDV